MILLLKRLFGSRNDRELKRIGVHVKKISELESVYAGISDETLRQKSDEFRQRLLKGETLEQLLPEAFAAVREAAKRTLGLRHFDVQMMGGVILHEGKIAEMGTGEGKTLVATLPVYLNALEGKGVHVVTVNDYLANRDGNWMRPVYEKLGLSVGIILSGQDRDSKQQAYRADITYGTNNEFGFDYLRDNMALRLEDKVQRDLHYAIVDEVDSILIDEARTPLIISGAAQDSSLLYKRINALIPRLQKGKMPESQGETTAIMAMAGPLPQPDGDYVIDEKHRHVDLTEQGHQKIEQLLVRDGLLKPDDSLYSASNLNLLHHVHSALRAHSLFHRDVEYIVENGRIVLIDEHTGRKMEGRRLSEGLHQAIEAKEGVAIQSESQTLASTTFQNYFRQYRKLSGMTGTADTEAPEFMQIYGLQVVVVPPNVPSKRQDLNDLIFLSKEEKYDAIIADVKGCLAKQAPVLVGTSSVETSEEMSRRLKKVGIEHQVLNAKFHAKEAEIIAQAGRPSAVTIATNMAGRGTDIVLGGNWQVELAALENPSDTMVAKIKAEWQDRHDAVIKSGGLHIIGTERHESRRIDNQLRGRAGRQGDPGVSRFYLSLEDDLMRIFAADRVKNMMQMMGMQHGEAIEHKMVTGSIEKAQRKVEGRNFDIRKQLLEFDDVANDQRQVIYQQRRDILEAESISDIIMAIRHDVISGLVSSFIPPQSLVEQWDIAGLESTLDMEFGVSVSVSGWLKQEPDCSESDIHDRIIKAVNEAYEQKCAHISAMGINVNQLEKDILLQVLDQQWKEHLASMDNLRQGIHLRAYAQKNPKQEYKRESFGMFESLLGNIKYEAVRVLARLQVARSDAVEELERKRREQQEKIRLQHARVTALGGEAPEESADQVPAPFVRDVKKVGRNEPCPCGSGKKYKQCHGQLG